MKICKIQTIRYRIQYCTCTKKKGKTKKVFLKKMLLVDIRVECMKENGFSSIPLLYPSMYRIIVYVFYR